MTTSNQIQIRDPFAVKAEAPKLDTEKLVSSLEISDLTGSRHDKTKQSIDRLAEKGVISQPPVGDGIPAANGVVEKIYYLTERDSYIVVAQISPKFTAALVDRWRKLEADLLNKPKINSDAKLMMSLPLYAEIKAQAYKDVQADLKGVGSTKFNRAVKAVWGDIGPTVPEAARDQLQSMLEFYMLNAFGFVKQRPVEQREIQRFGEWSK